ncbi:MAG: efflux RND transporter periplasmic adaptor subunit, partial [Verrucomicrobia bacterium]|nr:efflux RND transporter periplasmic adaptor subunit [Verrucomicrobiota bacterium]
VWILADAYEYEIPFLEQGQKVSIYKHGTDSKEFTGTIDYIYPYMNEKTRTLKFRIVVDNSDSRFAPGNYVNVKISKSIGSQLVINETAVIDTGERRYVFIESEPGHFVPVLISLGPKAGDKFVVEHGLTAGQKVVTDGTFLLDSESQLRGKQAQSADSDGTQHNH